MSRWLAVLVPAFVAGCGLMLEPPPEWVTNRLPLESCGIEDYGHGEGVNVEGRTCLLEAFEEGRGAELITTQSSVEGDPIVRYIRVHENATVEIFYDATRDRFGSGAWERLRCERLVPVEEFNDPPDIFFPETDVFVEDGCERLPLP
ncbi:MAG TPA: hypothetical protein VI277_00175 [Candidatus Limnocylindria bacterium]